MRVQIRLRIYGEGHSSRAGLALTEAAGMRDSADRSLSGRNKASIQAQRRGRVELERVDKVHELCQEAQRQQHRLVKTAPTLR